MGGHEEGDAQRWSALTLTLTLTPTLTLTKVTLNAREMLGPLQSMQQEKVKEETEDFRLRVADFVTVRLRLQG